MIERDQPQAEASKVLSPDHPANKARGYFFAAFETFPYKPREMVLGQNQPDSCVAACCRMLLRDAGIEIAEAFIRQALDLKEGSYVSQTPEVLRAFGFTSRYLYRNDLTVTDLAESVKRGPALAFVMMPHALDGHALLVEEIRHGLVAVRDPSPEVEGRAYRVGLADFTRVWLRRKTGCGQAAVVVG